MAGDNQYVQLRKRLRNLAKMREQGTLTPEEYDEQVALISDGDPTFKPPEQEQQPQPETNEEWMLHYLKESADQAGKQTTLMESIKGWVTFFGVLTVISLVLWAILIVVAIS